jgi:hypothetical protein
VTISEYPTHIAGKKHIPFHNEIHKIGDRSTRIQNPSNVATHPHDVSNGKEEGTTCEPTMVKTTTVTRRVRKPGKKSHGGNTIQKRLPKSRYARGKKAGSPVSGLQRERSHLSAWVTVHPSR